MGRGRRRALIRTPSKGELAAIASFVAALQLRPECRIPYFDESAEDIAAEIARWGDDWSTRCLVAERSGRLVGFVGVAVDRELGRGWIHGPFVEDGDWEALAADLLEHVIELAHVEDLELLGDGAHARLAVLAAGHEFPAGRRSLGLAISRAAAQRHPPAAAPGLENRHRDRFVALHESLFPRTYYSGDQLAEQSARGDAIVLIVVEDDDVLGYAVGRGRPAADGYVDFVGVAEHGRRRGYGRALTVAICHALLDDPSRSRVLLTVYEDNVAALALYDGLGFEQVSSMVGYRRRPEVTA